MTADGINEIISRGEGIEIEFKEAFFELPKTTFETVCAFLNRRGGHLLFGVSDAGKVVGVLEDAAPKMITELVNAANNPTKLSPPFYLAPQVMVVDGRTLIYCYVPQSSQVHRTAGKIFDRNASDGDVDVTANSHAVTQLYLRKQQAYTENRIYPYADLADFRPDLLKRVRIMAANQRPGHPWATLSDEALFQSAGLRLKDAATGAEGYSLAAVLLLGKDEAILSALPHHKTDALVRVHNLDRYDDRDDIRTNLIDSFDRLMAFVAKHLPDPFYLLGTQRISLRDRIFREVAANLLMHREFANAYPAKLIIEGSSVRTENWNRPHGHGLLQPDRFTPFPKNPVIARFFKEIGLADELGSGLRNAFRFVPEYSGGGKPLFEEEDVFRCTVPLPASAFGKGNNQDDDDTVKAVRDTVNNTVNGGVNDGVIGGVSDGVKKGLVNVMEAITKTPGLNAAAIAAATGTTQRTAERYLQTLKALNAIEFKGPPKTGGYFSTEDFEKRLADLPAK